MIIEKIGVTKGAFYHYFKSKDEILEAVTEDYASRLAAGINPIYEQGHMSALEKLSHGFQTAQRIRHDSRNILIPLMGLMNRDENTILKKRFYEKTVEKIKPSYIRMIYQGISEGVFETDFPEETAELIIQVGSDYRSKIASILLDEDRSPFYKEEIEKSIAFLQNFIERILGIKNGTFDIRKGFTSYVQ